eukprot:COSAG05_NODE_3057_length_2374_cov_1.756923_4_plen_243_part_00
MVAAHSFLALVVLFATGDVSVHAASMTLTQYVDAACSVQADGTTPEVSYDTPGKCEDLELSQCDQSTSPGACGGATHGKMICSGSTFDMQAFPTSDCSGTEVDVALLDNAFTADLNAQQFSSEMNGAVAATYYLFSVFGSEPTSGSCYEIFSYTVNQTALAAWYQTSAGGSLTSSSATSQAAAYAATFTSTTSTDPTSVPRFYKFEFDCDAIDPSIPIKGSGVFKINVFGSLVIAGIAYLTA